MIIDMQIDSSTPERLKAVHRAYDLDLRQSLDKENYERAAILRDTIKPLSDVILGYREFDTEIIATIYYACIAYGKCVVDEMDTEVYFLDDFYFQFFLDADKKKDKLEKGDTDALYAFLYRTHVKDTSTRKMFNLWWTEKIMKGE